MSCHDKSANASDVAVPEGVKMKSMKFDGCSFLYPDFLTKFKTPTAEGEEPDEEEEGQGMFVLNEGDLMNSLVYEERKLDTLYSKKAAEEFLQQLQADEGSTVNNSQIMDDGFMVDVEVLNAKVAPVKLYTTIAFKAKDLKSLTLTYTYTENNKEKMSAVKEAIVKSMKVQ
ncbi:MAG: hypothetical protein IKW98_11660 [Prevotella sp.]|nr:hypothetical protein [Prevotella sp.]